jgi:hypothetical protein
LSVFSAAVLVALALPAFQQVLARAAVEPEAQAVFVPPARTSPAAMDMLPEAADC